VATAVGEAEKGGENRRWAWKGRLGPYYYLGQNWCKVLSRIKISPSENADSFFFPETLKLIPRRPPAGDFNK
jgi:hypothetical protein